MPNLVYIALLDTENKAFIQTETKSRHYILQSLLGNHLKGSHIIIQLVFKEAFLAWVISRSDPKLFGLLRLLFFYLLRKISERIQAHVLCSCDVSLRPHVPTLWASSSCLLPLDCLGVSCWPFHVAPLYVCVCVCVNPRQDMLLSPC